MAYKITKRFDSKYYKNIQRECFNKDKFLVFHNSLFENKASISSYSVFVSEAHMHFEIQRLHVLQQYGINWDFHFPQVDSLQYFLVNWQFLHLLYPCFLLFFVICGSQIITIETNLLTHEMTIFGNKLKVFQYLNIHSQKFWPINCYCYFEKQGRIFEQLQI